MGRKSQVRGENIEGKKLLKEDEQQLLKKEIEVYWKDDKAWYKGSINQINPENKGKGGVTKPHFVVYADGDQEWVDLNTEQWILIEEEQARNKDIQMEEETQKDKQKRKSTTSDVKSNIGTSKKAKKEDIKTDTQKQNQSEMDASINECIEVDPLKKTLLAKTEHVLVEQCQHTPTLYQIQQILPVQDMNDVKVRCGECCVVIDCREKVEQTENENKDGEVAGSEVVVILPKKINNKSASAFMNKLGQLKVQVLASTDGSGKEIEMNGQLQNDQIDGEDKS